MIYFVLNLTSLFVLVMVEPLVVHSVTQEIVIYNFQQWKKN